VLDLYKDTFTPMVGKKLICKKKRKGMFINVYTVIENDNVVGHVLCIIPPNLLLSKSLLDILHLHMNQYEIFKDKIFQGCTNH